MGEAPADGAVFLTFLRFCFLQTTENAAFHTHEQPSHDPQCGFPERSVFHARKQW